MKLRFCNLDEKCDNCSGLGKVYFEPPEPKTIQPPFGYNKIDDKLSYRCEACGGTGIKPE